MSECNRITVIIQVCALDSKLKKNSEKIIFEGFAFCKRIHYISIVEFSQRKRAAPCYRGRPVRVLVPTLHINIVWVICSSVLIIKEYVNEFFKFLRVAFGQGEWIAILLAI